MTRTITQTIPNYGSYILSYILLNFLILLLTLNQTTAQSCAVIAASTEGYTVHVNLTYKELVKDIDKKGCKNGYSYKVAIDYEIYFTGVNAPDKLYTLQGFIYCDDKKIFFNLPNEGGVGTVYSSNAHRKDDDCETSTPETLECGENTETEIKIHGPGIKTTENCLSSNVGASTLPIVWGPISTSYNQAKNQTEVSWTTYSEIDVIQFEIQQSVDNLHWETVLTTASRGEIDREQNYSFSVPAMSASKVYYRIQQEDWDGHTTYSPIKQIQKPLVDTQKRIIAYPNPTTDYIIIQGASMEADQLRIFNYAGKEVSRNYSIVSADKDRITLDLSNIPTGFYFLKIGEQTQRISKL